jgi:hypothetical protein
MDKDYLTLKLKRASAPRSSGQGMAITTCWRRRRAHLPVAHSADAAELRERSLPAIRFR